MPRPTGGTAQERIMLRANAIGKVKEPEENTARSRILSRAAEMGEVKPAEAAPKYAEETTREPYSIAALGAGNYGADKRIFGEGYNFGQGLAKAGQIGLTDIAHIGGFIGTQAENLLGAFIKEGSNGVVSPDVSKWPMHRWDAKISAEAEAVRQKYAENTARGGRAAEVAEDLGAATVAALPQAGAAILTGGASSVMTAEQLAARAAASPGIVNTISTGLRRMAKDPNFKLAFIQAEGSGYMQAKADGADDFRATVYAVGNGLMNAAVEVGGGIQTLPKELQGGTSAWKAWVDSMLVEGKEEAVQGVIERAMQNAVYDKGNPLVGIGNDAIFDPAAAAEEFAGGAVVGGILSGGQIGVNALGNRVAYDAAKAQYDRDVQRNTAPEINTKAAEAVEAVTRGETITGNQAAAIARDPVAVEVLEQRTGVKLDTDKPISQVKRDIAGLASREVTQEKQRATPPSPAGQKRAERRVGGFLENGQKAYQEMSRTAEDAPSLYAGFSSVYNAGLNGIEADKAKGKYAAMLTPEQRYAAYNAGLEDAREQLARENAEVASVTTTAGAGLADNEYSRYLIAAKKNTAATLNAWGKKLGVRIEIVDQVLGGRANGQYLKEQNLIQIAADSDKPLLNVTAHEITHRMQDLSPAEYRKFRQAAVEYKMQENGADTEAEIVERYMEAAEQEGVTLTRDEVMDELAADFAGDMLDDADLFAKFSKENRTAAQKLLDSLKEFLAKVKTAFTGKYRDMAAQEAYGKDFAELEDIAKQWQAAFDAAAQQAEKAKTAASDGDGAKYQIRMEYAHEIDEWAEDGRPGGETFVLGSTGPVLQGLGAIENDIFMESSKINKILVDHPEMTLEEIKSIPQILEDPVLVLKSRGKNAAGDNSRMVLFGTVKAQNGQPIMTIMDLRPRGKGFVIDDMQKVNSAYTKKNLAAFIYDSEVLYADKKRTVPLLRLAGLTITSQQLLRNGSIGSISYNGNNVNIEGVPFAEIVGGEKGDGKYADTNATRSVGVSVDANTESASPAQYSLKTWSESDYVAQRKKAAEELSAALNVSIRTATKYIDSINSVAKMIANDRVRLDYEASPGRSGFVGNSEYGGSLDFSTICKKRRLLTGTMEAIQNALPNTALTAEEILTIRKMMADKGYEVSCGLCYVEGSRANMGKYTQEFLAQYAETNPQYLPNMAEMNTATGQEKLRISHPEVYEAYEKYMNKLAQRKPKLYQLATEYQGEIRSKFKGKGSVEAKNRNGGMRLQSFSDFEIIHLIDCMQAIMDMSEVGLAGQAYTKVPDFAWALGNTGLKINLSLIAKGVDANGNLILDETEGMHRADAEKLRNAYSKNVGTILVVFNDEQLSAAMRDNFIDFIIPFHRSQWNSTQYGLLGLPEGAKDYTPWQNESFIDPVYNKNGKKQRPSNYMPNEYWDFRKSGKENAEAYLQMCAQNNRKPKFSYLLDKAADGAYALKKDGSTDGYWKLLIDFKMYDNNGRGVPQQPVKPTFNMAECERMLNEYQGGHQTFPAANDVVDQFVQEYKETHPDSKFSLKAYSEAEKKDHVKSAKEFFGKTYSWNETGYITTDGTKLDFSGRHDGGPGGYRAVDHRDIRDALGLDYGGDDYSGAMVQFMGEGNIRISPESGGINLSVMPTKAQFDSLADFISKNRGEVILDLDDANGNTVSSTEYPRGTHSSKVINDIKAYFENGTTPQVSELGKFRYQLKNTAEVEREARELKKERNALAKQNEALKQRVQELKGEMRISKEPSVVARDVKKLGQNLIREYGSDVKYADVQSEINALAKAVMKRDVTMEDLMPHAKAVAEAIVDNTSELTEYGAELLEIRDHLKRQTIQFSGDMANYGDFRKSHMGTLKLSKDNGTSVDTVYGELTEMFGEGYFPSDVYTEADKLLQIGDVLDGLDSVYHNPFEGYRDAAVQEIANQLIDGMISDQVRQKKTYADRRALENQEAVGRVREMLSRERQKRRDDVNALRKKYNEKTKKGSEKRKATAMRARIARHTGAISRKLVNPTDKQHIPEKLRVAVASLLQNINLESAYSYDENGRLRKNADGDPTRRTLEADRLKQIYDDILDNEGNMVVDPALTESGGLLDSLSALGGKRIADMSVSELETVWNAIRAIETTLTTYDKTLSSAKYKSTSEWAERFAADSMGRKRRNRKISLDMADPYTFFSAYGDAGKQLYRTLRNAQDQQHWMLRDVQREAEKFLDKNVYKNRFDRHTFTTGRGVELTLTTDQIMNLYNLARRGEQAMHHLTVGGIVQPEIKRDGKLKEIPRGNDNILLTEEDIKAITSVLTPEQVKVANGLQKLASTKLAEWGNNASMQVYGYRKFKEEHYWPIKAAKDAVASSVEKDADNARSIKNMGSAKALTPNASNALDIGGAYDVFAQNASDMIKYATLLAPMEDINRLYNYRYRDSSGNLTGRNMQQVLSGVYGDAAQKYWRNLMRDMQNGMVKNSSDTTRSIERIVGNTKGAAVGSNWRVVIQQPTAFFRAAVILDPENMAKGLGNGVTKGNGWDKARKWAAIAGIKDSSGFDQGSRYTIAREVYGSSDSVMDKLSDWSSRAAANADAITWGKIWNACEWQVAADTKTEVGSDAYYRQVAELFTDVIDQTQVVDGIMQRTQIMRDSDALTRQATSFMGEPLKSLNILMRSYDAWRFETNTQKRSAALKQLKRSVGALLVTDIINSLAQSLVDALRDDDKEKKYWARFFAALTGVSGDEESFGELAKNVLLEGNLKGNITLVGRLPYAKDLISILQGYSVERMDADAIGDIVRATQTMYSSITGEGKYTTAYACKQLLTAVSKIFGVSVANLGRDVWAAARSAANETGNVRIMFEMEKAIYRMDRSAGNRKRWCELLYLAQKENDTKTARMIYKEMLEHGYDEKDVRQGVEAIMKTEQKVKSVDDLKNRWRAP